MNLSDFNPKEHAPFLIAVNDLRFSDHNPRTISKKNLEKLKKSLVDFERMLWLRPLVIDENNTVLGGNKRGEAVKQLEITFVPAVRAIGLTEDQKKEFIIKDNVGFGAWDWEKLQGENWEIEKLNDWGLEIPAEEKTAIGINEDNFIEPKKIETDIVLGDLFQIGEHFLLCGDAYNIGHHNKLMNGITAHLLFTDPPYGVNANGGRSGTVKKLNMLEIENDDLRGARLINFLHTCLGNAKLKSDASWYVCYDHKTQLEFSEVILKMLSWNYQNTIVWNKNVFGLSGFKGYRPKHELIMFGSLTENYLWHGGNDQSNVWDIARPNINERAGNHRTPKPVAIPATAIKNSSLPGETVLDIFAGVGSTMVACEQLNRKCFAMELEPQHCQSIIKRMQELKPEIKILKNGGAYNG